MYFTRWHVSSEFLSVAIAAQVTMCAHIDGALHLGDILAFHVCPASLAGYCRLCGAAPFFICSMRGRWLHAKRGMLMRYCAGLPPGAAPVLAHPVLGAGLPAAEQQARLSLCVSARALVCAFFPLGDGQRHESAPESEGIIQKQCCTCIPVML
jgi:hypothetical protein